MSKVTSKVKPIVFYLMHESPPSRAVFMAIKHLNISVKNKMIDLGKGDHLKPDFVALNPQHTVPTIDDNGFILWESRAILAYLVSKFAPDSSLYPKDLEKRATIDRMLDFDLGILYQRECDYFAPLLEGDTNLDPEKEKKLKEALDLLEIFLSKTKYAAGDELTIADFSLISSLTYAEVADYHLDEYQNITQWQNRIKELPYYHECHDKGNEGFRDYINSMTKDSNGK